MGTIIIFCLFIFYKLRENFIIKTIIIIIIIDVSKSKATRTLIKLEFLENPIRHYYG